MIQFLSFLFIDSCNTATELLPGDQSKVQRIENRTGSDNSGETQFISITLGTIGGVILLILIALGVVIQRYCCTRITEFLLFNSNGKICQN